jgi:hypothetical protein
MEETNFFEDFRNLQKTIGTITKNAKGFNYSYLDLVKLYDEIEPKLEQNNFIVLSTARRTEGVIKRTDDKVIIAKDKFNNPTLTGARTYESPCYEIHTELCHSSGRMITCDLPLYVDDIDPQALGSAITYMRRYSIFVVLGIKTQDDDGASASAKDKSKRNVEREPLPDDINEIATFLARQENPKVYYRDIVDNPSIPDELKRKLKKIMYPN